MCAKVVVDPSKVYIIILYYLNVIGGGGGGGGVLFCLDLTKPLYLEQITNWKLMGSNEKLESLIETGEVRWCKHLECCICFLFRWKISRIDNLLRSILALTVGANWLFDCPLVL